MISRTVRFGTARQRAAGLAAMVGAGDAVVAAGDAEAVVASRPPPQPATPATARTMATTSAPRPPPADVTDRLTHPPEELERDDRTPPPPPRDSVDPAHRPGGSRVPAANVRARVRVGPGDAGRERSARGSRLPRGVHRRRRGAPPAGAVRDARLPHRDDARADRTAHGAPLRPGLRL